MKWKTYVVLLVSVILLAACAQDPAKLLQQADANRKLGQFDKAIKQYEKVVKKQPGNAEAHLGLGLSYLEKGNKAEAKNSFNDVIKLGNPPDIVSQANEKLGDILLQEGDPAQALKYYRNVSGVNAQKILNTRIELVRNLLNKGDKASGSIEMLHLIKNHEKEPGVQNLLKDPILKTIYPPLRAHFIDEAETVFKAGKFDSAINLLARSQQFAPAAPPIENKANEIGATAYSELGKCGPASKLWAKVSAFDPAKKPEADFYDIVCAMKSKKYLDALKRFEAIPNTGAFFQQAQVRIADTLKFIETKRFKVQLDQGNVRAGPGQSQKLIETLQLAKEVRVIESVAKTGWFRINYKGERSAYMHSSVITDKPLAVNVKKNGWEQTKGEDWMIAFQPVIELKLTNLTAKPISSIQIKMTIKQGNKVFSSDVFNIEVEKNQSLKPDQSIVEKIIGTAKQELLTRPEEAIVIIHAAIDKGEFFLYREFYLTRQVVDEKG